MIRFFSTFIFILLLFFSLLYISEYKYFLTGISKFYFKVHTTAFLNDYQSFDNRLIKTSKNIQPWIEHSMFNKFQFDSELENYHSKTKTVAFLIIKNDSLLYEKYYDGYDRNTKSNSFSMSKSIVSALMGIAIQEGLIKSLDQRVVDFLPELTGSYANLLTVGDLSSMASGLKWDESYYSPFSITTRSYVDEDLNKLILNQPIDSKPGESFRYLSGATQLLAMVIQKATGKKISNYLSEKFWQPMGAENDALWQIDSKSADMEKAYCCLASTARDFARFGKLYKDFGKWNQVQLLDSIFVSKSLKPRFNDSPHYGYGWWLRNYNGYNTFMMRGHLGQYVIVVPEEDLIIVRLGHRKDRKIEDEDFTKDIFVYLDAGIEINESQVLK